MQRIKDVGKTKRFGKILREQNCDRRSVDRRVFKGLESFWSAMEKFTVVELVFDGKRYHGLSVRSKQDDWSTTEGIARAYLRAFDALVDNQINKEHFLPGTNLQVV